MKPILLQPLFTCTAKCNSMNAFKERLPKTLLLWCGRATTFLPFVSVGVQLLLTVSYLSNCTTVYVIPYLSKYWMVAIHCCPLLMWYGYPKSNSTEQNMQCFFFVVLFCIFLQMSPLFLCCKVKSNPEFPHQWVCEVSHLCLTNS